MNQKQELSSTCTSSLLESHITKLGVFSARLIKVEKPLYGVEVFVGETARFEIELSEPDVHGQWKLKGEPLTASPVSQD